MERQCTGRLGKTLLVGLTYFSAGTSYAAIFSTLPELAKVYKSDPATVSLMYIPEDVGKIFLAILMGGGKLKGQIKNPYWTLFLMQLFISLTLFLYPTASYISALFVIAFCSGVVHQIMGAVGTTEIMTLWQDGNTEPYLHFVHLCLALGVFFSPSLAAQLLPGPSGEPDWVLFQGLPGLHTFYFIIATSALVPMPLLAFFASRYRQNSEDESNTSKKDRPKSWPARLLIMLFVGIFFCRSSFTLFGYMVSVFGVESHLHLSSAQGAQLSSIFWGSSISVRILSIALATKLRAKRTIHAFMAMAGLPCLYILCRDNELSLPELQTSIALTALGSGPVYSMTVVFFEEFVPVDLPTTGLFFLGHSVGQNVWAPLVAAFVEANPFVLFWVTTVNAGICSSAYLTLALFMTKIRARIKDDQTTTEELLMNGQ